MGAGTVITDKAWKVLEAAREYREARQRFDAEDDPEASHQRFIEVQDAQEALKAAAMEMGDE